MATVSTTTEKVDELQLCYDMKKDSHKHIKELERIIKTLAAEVPKSIIQTRSNLRNVLCRGCRMKAFETLQLHLVAFTDTGCQTENRFTDPEMSNDIKHRLSRNIVNMIEEEMLTYTTSLTGSYGTLTYDSNTRDKGAPQIDQDEEKDEQPRRTNQSVAVQTLQDKRDDVLESMKTEKGRTYSQIECLEQEKQKLQCAVDGLTETLRNTESKLKEIRTENKKLKHSQGEVMTHLVSELQEKTESLRIREDELKSLKAEKAEHDLNMKQMKQEKQNLKTKQDEINTKLTEMESELEKTKTNNKSLEDSLNARDAELKSVETEKGKLVSETERVRQEKQDLQTKLGDLNTKMAGTESELQKTKTYNKTLANDLNARNAELKTLKTKRGKLDSQTERVKQEKQDLQTKLDDLNTKMADTELELQKTKRHNTALTCDLRAREDELQSLKNEKVKLDSDLESSKQEKLLETKQRDLNTQMMEMESKLKNAKTENKKLADSQRARDDALTALKNENVELDSQLERTKQEKQLLENRIDNLNTEMMKLESELKKTKTELTDTQNVQREESDTLRHQIKELSVQKKKRVVLGLRSERNGLEPRLVDMVTKELTRGLQQRLDIFGFNLTISFSQTLSDVTNGLQIVLCKSIPGTGTSITDTLKGLKADRDMFVMVLHLTSEENVSALTPTSHRVTGSELRQIGGILDMACSNQRGLYDCYFNYSAVEKIASIIKKLVVL